MFSYWWIPLTITIYACQAYFSQQNKHHGGIWFYILWISGMIPLWGWVSKYSKDLLFDGMIYDVILFLSYALTTIALGEGGDFGLKQWIALIVITFGFILLKS